MVLYDATIGNVLHTVNTLAVAYYICWVAITPFVDTVHFTQRLFPPREYGLALPAVFVVFVAGVALTVAAWHLAGAKPSELVGLVEPRGGEVMSAAVESASAPRSGSPLPPSSADSTNADAFSRPK